MLAAFAEAARALERDDYWKVGQRNAEFLMSTLRQEKGHPLRTRRRRPSRSWTELTEDQRPTSTAT
jgi:uncharacterized protein YyaL (SSP411 family)